MLFCYIQTSLYDLMINWEYGCVKKRSHSVSVKISVSLKIFYGADNINVLYVFSWLFMENKLDVRISDDGKNNSETTTLVLRATIGGRHLSYLVRKEKESFLPSLILNVHLKCIKLHL